MCGSGYCKFGWSKYDAPSGRAATFLEFGNIEAPMYSRLRHFFTTIYSRCSSLFSYIERGIYLFTNC
ncbi:putative Actin family [Helianthus anomalus]